MGPTKSQNTLKAEAFSDWSQRDTAKERIIQGKSKHFNIYTCDKFKSGKCYGCYSENEA